MKVSVIVPAYNEEATIQEVLQTIRRQQVAGIEFEVIVIDDCSADSTGAILDAHPELYTHCVRRRQNGGKGAAVLDGLKVATGDYILFQDADLEYDPSEYAALMMPILRFNADIVMGSRLMAPAFTRVAYFWHRVGNHLITFLFNVLNNTTFSDIYSCYLCYRRELVTPERLRSRGWEQQAEILSHAVANGSVFYEVPISYHGRTYEEGKKIRAHHIIAVLLMIVRGRFIR
jgi:glycosyltransferase involved in cell wall biosynthesis